MNKLSFISSIPSNTDTYIYVLPTNSQKSLNLDEVSIKVHILDLRGNSLLVFPAASASSDGVCFTLSNLANLGSGTYAIYLELLYAHHQEFYPNDSVKYITINDDDSGNLTFVNMFTAESSSIVPPQDTKSDLTDVLHVHDIDLKSIITNTLASGLSANVSLDQNDNLIFDIPAGPKGDPGATGPVGATGPKGNRGYNFWYDINDYGENKSGCYWSDLKGSSPSQGPQVGDIVITPKGNIVQITGVIIGGPQGTGGGTFSYGPYLANLQGEKGDTGSIDNAGLTNAPAFQALQAESANSGGVNLLQGTRDFYGIYISGDKVAVTNGGENFQAAFGTYKPAPGNPDIVGFYSIPLEKDTDYTASFWVKTSEDTDITSFLYDSGSNGIYSDGATVNHSTTDYTRIVVHFHNGNNSATVSFVPARTNNAGVTVWIYGCMFEKGTVAHDWSPAPNEILTQSDYAKIKAAIVALGGSLS